MSKSAAELSPVSPSENIPKGRDQIFIEQHRNEISAAGELFMAKDLQTFLTIKNALQDLLKKYMGGEEEGELPVAVLDEIIGKEYLENSEAQYSTLNQSNGLYVSLGGAGGGDYWFKDRNEAGVGEVSTASPQGKKIEIMDIMGHGSAVLASKALVARCIDLYKAQPRDKQVDMFYALDRFLADAPWPSHQFEYIGVRVRSDAEGNHSLDVECYGAPTCFVRDDETGLVILVNESKRVPITKYNSLERKPIDGNVLIGRGFLRRERNKVENVPLPKKATVYVLSDGLFDMSFEGRSSADTIPFASFAEQFEFFCWLNRNLSGKEFREKLIADIRELAKMFAGDDLTLATVSTETESSTA